MVGFASNEQLRVIDELPRGEDALFSVAMTVASVEGETPRLVTRNGSGSFHLGAG
ncbi:hypothetical protein [Micromonospora zamorensis]|uniref:hypothetical protein n=1 Tax=Micromonospora zamorensis TaxID=709883 RepID=UPI0008200323|nr:hypothetical protein [Micromonospora zamorensis]SCG45797.1 hypothetical protein GA0070619_1740 [Micromonospora zamorensis]